MVTYTTDEVETGYPSAVLETLRRRIGQYSSMAVCEYIGKTSGTNGESAMRSCYNQNKRDWGIQEMILLYQSKSENFANQVRSDLIELS